MKYTQEIEIDRSRGRVVELFEDLDNLPKWQPGFVSLKHVSGEEGQEGSVSELVYQMGNRCIEMTRTVLVHEPPERFDGVYEARGIKNIQYNRFVEVGDHRCKWVSANEFQFAGLLSLMGFLMQSPFKKQSMKCLQLFKEFAESTGAN